MEQQHAEQTRPLSRKEQGRILGALVRRGMKKKAESGGLPGCAPLGYKNVRDAFGTHVEIDEEMAPMVKAAFKLAASGKHPLREIQRTITEDGLRSRNGKSVGVSGLWYLLSNPFYAGFVRYGGQLLPGKHSALIDASTFARVQDGLLMRKRLLDKPAAL